jgi:hypothetical protein
VPGSLCRRGLGLLSGYCNDINEVGKLVYLVGEKFLSGGGQQLGHFL